MPGASGTAAGSRGRRGRVWRGVAHVALATLGTLAVTGGVAYAEEPPADPPSMPVETGVIDGAIVAVGLPPVPETPPTVPVETGVIDGATVAVGLPPVPETPPTLPEVPPTLPDVADTPVSQPPAGDADLSTTEIVAVGLPPVPPFTVPDAEPSGGDASLSPLLPETGSTTAATAIVAGAAASVGAALVALSRRP